jgi:lactam utilization protein B
VSTTGGHELAVNARTICVHSDTPDAATLAAELSRALRTA